MDNGPGNYWVMICIANPRYANHICTGSAATTWSMSDSAEYETFGSKQEEKGILEKLFTWLERKRMLKTHQILSVRNEQVAAALQSDSNHIQAGN